MSYLRTIQPSPPLPELPDTPLFCNFHSGLRETYRAACQKLEGLKTRRIALASNGPGSSIAKKTLCLVPLRQRGCEGYSYWLMNRVARADFSRLHGFLTLTVNPAHSCCAHHAWSKIWKRWNSFRTNARKKGLLKKYFCVLEPTKAFRPHLHILLNSSRLPRAKLTWLHRLWGAGIYYRYTRVHSPVAYLMKYLGKDLRAACTPDSLLSRFHGYLRAFRIRQWSCSRGLIPPYKKSSDSTWEYAGTYSVDDLRAYRHDSDLIYADEDATAPEFLSSWGCTRKHLIREPLR